MKKNLLDDFRRYMEVLEDATFPLNDVAKSPDGDRQDNDNDLVLFIL